MDFAYPTLFVLSSSNTLATTGTTSDLASGQFTAFGPDYAPASAGDIASDPYFYLAQGRPAKFKDILPTKQTAKIYKNRVIDWYKVTASSATQNQITTLSEFTIQCGETLTVSLRLNSFYINQAFYNGMTKSFTAVAPCCDCGEDVCEDLDPQALVDDLVTQINSNTLVNPYITASRGSSGLTSTLVLTGKSLGVETFGPDYTVNTPQYDRLSFKAWVYAGPETSQDYMIYDLCDVAGTVTTSQEATVAHGDSATMKKLEMFYQLFENHPLGKMIYKDLNYNIASGTEITDGTFYDMYYCKYENSQSRDGFSDTVPMDYEFIVMNPTGQNAGTIAVLTAALGTAPEKA